MKTPTLKDLQAFGRTVRQARFHKGLTQEKLGKMCGVAGDTISKIERGDTGPKPQTIKRLEKALGISAKRFLDLGPGGEVMEGLQGLTDQVRLLTEKVTGMEKTQNPINPVLPDAAEATGSRAQMINALSDLQNRVVELENGVANPSPEQDEEEPEKESPDEVIDKLLTEHEDLKNQGIFKDFDNFWSGESKEERTFKAQLYVDICHVCDGLDLNAFEEVKGGLLTSTATRAEAIRDVLVDFCTDDISKDDAQKELEKYLKPANPEDKSEDEHFSDGW